jgi:predicted nuclease of predicted toxin-antitoxin system
MRLRFDENMPRPLGETLRSAGHDIHTAADEDLLGEPDSVVWAAAVRERRLLLTLDRDFGRLATVSKDRSGAIVLRPRDANRATIVAMGFRAVALAAEIDMNNRIAILEDERIRIRPPLSLVTPQEPS